MIRLNEKDINTPEHFDNWFDNKIGVSDMKRFELGCKYFKGGLYVDVGCFDSIMPIILSERFPEAEIHALDFSPKVIGYFKVRFPKVKYQRIDTCYNLPYEDNSVDYLFSGELIEHLEEPQKFVKECLRVVKKGGVLVVTTPHEEANKESKIGGAMHLWSYDEKDLKDMGFTEITILKEENSLTFIAWQKK